MPYNDSDSYHSQLLIFGAGLLVTAGTGLCYLFSNCRRQRRLAEVAEYQADRKQFLEERLKAATKKVHDELAKDLYLYNEEGIGRVSSDMRHRDLLEAMFNDSLNPSGSPDQTRFEQELQDPQFTLFGADKGTMLINIWKKVCLHPELQLPIQPDAETLKYAKAIVDNIIDNPKNRMGAEAVLKGMFSIMQAIPGLEAHVKARIGVEPEEKGAKEDSQELKKFR